MPFFPLLRLRSSVNDLEPPGGKKAAPAAAIPDILDSFLAEQCAERPAAVKGAPLFGAAKRTLEGEDRSARIPQEGMPPSFLRLLTPGRLFIMR
jgi:hypothetical protein